MTIQFKEWPKITRWQDAKWVVTEKIDGTNSCVIVDEFDNIAAQSRTRLITCDKDNFGFAAWVEENAEELKKLGQGHHFGEWWGKGIQRGYGLDERRFSLFCPEKCNEIPECCYVVPEICVLRDLGQVYNEITYFRAMGSLANSGFMNTEGVILRESFSNIYLKYVWSKR